ncbi:MAG: HVA1 family protein, partial [Pseudomonadota bacterium]
HGRGVAGRRQLSDQATGVGTAVTHNASADNPAFLIEQEDGDLVLKSASELSAD